MSRQLWRASALVMAALAGVGASTTRPASRPATGPAEPYWLGPMKKLHAEFKGTRGYVAQFGDSITHSMAFWSPMGWSDPSVYLPADDGLPKKPPSKRWRDVIKGARAKGAGEGNYSGWRVGSLLRSVDDVLAKRKPEVAIVMIGTNDIWGGSIPAGYRAGLEGIVSKCLARQCIPVLNTIPPFRGRDRVVAGANGIIRKVAAKYRVPLVDYHAAILTRRPGHSWDGTLISKDGVHPAAGKTHVYSEENLRVSGYALRNWVNFLMYRRIYFRILEAPKS